MNLTQSQARKIINKFAKAISERKTSTSKPSKTVIDFRSEKRDGFEREIVNVPLELLKFRKDNGRITSGILSYERSHGQLEEANEEGQKVIGKLLKDKDPERTDTLRKLIYTHGQETPAIITCDGFLIDGNRRLLVLKIFA